MNLKSIFLITLSGLLLVILVVVFAINIKTTQEFIQNQVYATSQDNAHSLAMSLSNLDTKTSQKDVKLIINALFDSGYYEYIRYYDKNDTLVYENSFKVVVKDVPSWFISFISLDIQEATSSITHGWTQNGKVAVKAHPGYAYYKIYKEFQNLLLVFGLIAVVSFILLLFIINTVLRSLTQIKNQANAINEHHFLIEKKTPFITEFALLTGTMNKMVKKVESIFKSEVQTYELLQNSLYKDEESQLTNKKFFMLKLQETLEDETKNRGYVAIISIDGLKRIKQEKSYGYYKDTLLNIISHFPKELSEENLVSRLSEEEIVILFNSNDIEAITKSFEELREILNVTSRDITTKEKLFCFSIGVAPFFEDDKISQTLSRLDYSLSHSKIGGCNIIDLYQEQENQNALVISGKNSWKEIFEKIFNEDRIVLAMQNVVNAKTKSVFHEEALLRIQEENGSLQTAGYYLPMANALGIVAKFDEHVINHIITNIDTFSNSVGINVSKNFVLKSVHFLQLRSHLESISKTHAQKLHFECSENEVIQYLNTFIEFAEMIHAQKQLFGIDRFTGIENISYIEKLRPNYVKVNANFIIRSNEENKTVLRTLNVLSKTIGFHIIVTAVQTQEQIETLQALEYEYFQGLYISDIIA